MHKFVELEEDILEYIKNEDDVIKMLSEIKQQDFYNKYEFETEAHKKLALITILARQIVITDYADQILDILKL